MEVLIIGGGASGMMASIAAASMGASVTIYEHNDILGKKLRTTGNGRCNLGNMNLKDEFYYSPDRDMLSDFFIQFDEDDTIRTFRSLGLIIKDENGYMYPACEQAKVVADVLETQLRSYGVNVCTSVDIDDIKKNDDNSFTVTTDGRSFKFDKVVLACGSYAGIAKKDRIASDKDGYALAYSFGHTIMPVKPALTAIKCDNDFLDRISGVRADVLITLVKNGTTVATEYGQLQMTDYGVSGIPAFQLSHYVGADKEGGYELLIDFMPGVDDDDYIAMMQSRIFAFQGYTIEQFFLGTLNTKLCDLIIDLAGLNRTDMVDEETEDDLITALGIVRCLKLNVTGVKDFSFAQVCSGGVPLNEIDRNCMSVKTPGLYICGEMLDVDGMCGGYNLQWAWTSGYIAGRAAGCY